MTAFSLPEVGLFQLCFLACSSTLSKPRHRCGAHGYFCSGICIFPLLEMCDQTTKYRNWINRSATKLLHLSRKRNRSWRPFVSRRRFQCKRGPRSGFSVHLVAVKLWMDVIASGRAAEMQAADEPSLLITAATTTHCAHRAINTSRCQCCDTFKYSGGIISPSATPFSCWAGSVAAGSLLKLQLLPTVMWNSGLGSSSVRGLHSLFWDQETLIMLSSQSFCTISLFRDYTVTV